MKRVGTTSEGNLLMELDAADVLTLQSLVLTLRPLTEAPGPLPVASEPPAGRAGRGAKPKAKKPGKRREGAKRDKKCRTCKATFHDDTNTNCRRYCDQCAAAARAKAGHGKPLPLVIGDEVPIEERRRLIREANDRVAAGQ